MRPFKILYIEHEPGREHYRTAMEKVEGVEVKLLEGKQSEIPLICEEAIKREHFDLVITDTHFLDPDVSHESETMDGNYWLDRIVELIRKADRRTRIAILTHFTPNLLADDNKVLDFHKVDHIWDKHTASLDIIKLYIERIKSESQSYYPESVLFNSLQFLIDNSDDESLPWRLHIQEGLEQYKSKFTEKDQVEAVSKNLKNMARDFGFDETNFDRLFSAFRQSELFNIAGKPSTWGHLRHVLNVYWLGYYILNSANINYKEVVKKLDIQVDGKTDEEIVNAVWFIIALFHDVGLLGERTGNLINGFNNLIKIYPKLNLSLTMPDDALNSTDMLKDDIGNLKGKLDSDLLGWFEAGIECSEGKINHGILSGCTIMKWISNEEFENIANIAAVSVALHNLAQKAAEMFKELNDETEKECIKKFKNIPDIKFEKYPFACLLILCDQLEVWDRNTGQESILTGFALESGELTDLKYEDNTFYGTINYLPFRNVLNETQFLENTKNGLEDIISYSTKKILKKLKFPDDIKFDIKFLFNGRHNIGIWKTF